MSIREKGAQIADSLVSLLECALEDPQFGDSATAGHRHVGRRVMAFIAEHYAEVSIGPRHCAEQIGMPVRTLHHCLAREGQTFMTLLRQHRLQCARAMLSASRRPLRVNEVSRRCGFRSADHFSRLFRERYGVSPVTFAAAR